MSIHKNLKVAVFDSDLNNEFLFGVEFLEDKIVFNYSKDDDPSPEFKNCFEKFGMSLNVVFQILYESYMV